MLVSVLRARHPVCSPGAKFVLLRFIQLYGVDTSVEQSVKAMAKEIGVTDRVAGEALPQLVAQGLLGQQSSRGKLGRPSSSYTCPKAALAERVDLGREDGSSSEHTQRIAKLLSGAGSQPSQRLMYANRLLLAVLLAHADEFGAVRGLGLRDLSKLTGLRKEVLRHRLDVLVAHGFIRAIVPGVTGTKLFKLTPSQYFLDLGHPLLAASVAPRSVVIRTRSSYSRGDHPARLILEAVRRSKLGGKKYIQFSHGFFDVADLFDDLSLERLEPVLQATLDRYAALLLSKYSVALANVCPVVDELFEHIRADFNYLGAEVLGGTDSSDTHGSMAVLLNTQAVIWAREIHAAIKHIEGPLTDDFKCLVLPPSKDAITHLAFWALLVISDQGPVRQGSRLYDIFSDLDRSYEHEAEIPLEDRYRYGLLTRPRRSAEAKESEVISSA